MLNGRGLIISGIVSIFAALIIYGISDEIIRSVSIGLGVGLFFLILFNRALQKLDRNKLLFAGVMLFIMTISEFIHVQADTILLLNRMALDTTSYILLWLVPAVIAAPGIIVFIVKSLRNRTKISSFSVLGIVIGFVCAEMILYNLSSYMFMVNKNVGAISLALTSFISTHIELLLCPITLSIVTRMSPIRTSASIVAVYFVCFALVTVSSQTYSKITVFLASSEYVSGIILIFFSMIVAVLYFVFKPKLEKTYEKLMEENAS